MSLSPEQIRRMFGRIAGRYDLLNSVLSLGQHRRWKVIAARASRVPRGGVALDVCCGTGDIALALADLGASAVGLDFSLRMLTVARRKAEGKPIALVQGDALSLPFRDDSFDAAVVGFTLRNVASIPRLLSEMARVVRPGGWVVSLETSQPACAVVRAIFRAYLEVMVALTPLLSKGAAYRYLLRTILAFPPAEEIAGQFRAAGLVEVLFTPLLLGAAAVHMGRLPPA